MSRQYGRNQKRQARQLLQEAVRRAGRYERYLMLARRRVNSLEGQLDDVSQILDKHFTGFDPGEMRVSHLEMLRMDRLQSIGAPIIGGASPMEMMPYYVRELHCMTTEVLYEAFGDSVHIRVHHQETGQIGYAITKRAMMDMPKDVFINRVSHEIAMQLRQLLSA